MSDLTTIALLFFMIGTGLILTNKKPKYSWISFITAYFFLIVQFVWSWENLSLMLIISSMNIFGFIKSLKRGRKK